MALNQEIKQQLEQYMALLEGPVVIKINAADDETSLEMKELVEEVASMSDYIRLEAADLPRTPSFSVNRPDEETGIIFAGVPLGHEFSSLVLALVQVSGRAPKEDEAVLAQARALKGTYNFETYVSLSCHNCPDVVQALNLLSLVNPNVTHTMIEGGAFKEEVEAKDILAVPAIYLNGEFFEGGRQTLSSILNKLKTVDGSQETEEDKDISGDIQERDPYDVLVIGGGPAGASAAIYAARKGIRTGIVAERFGGQVMDTMDIENFISVKKTQGPSLSASLEEHVLDYDVDVVKNLQATGLTPSDMVEVELNNGAILKSRSVILATGAKWRHINVPGEAEFANKGVAYCPHCDGPMFEGKDVAVIGGGNSGIEAAIDLAGITKHVTVLEFLPELKADSVLQDKLFSLDNVTVHTNVATKEITGTSKVDGLTYTDRESGEEHHVDLSGVFVQIGLVPNTAWLEDTVDKNRFGEITVDKYGATSMEGVFAAGDCTDSAFKQIIISMGSGATAALGAFDYLIRSSVKA